MPASRIERSECVPLPEAIFAVSPPMNMIVLRVHAEQVGHHLREAGLVALAGRLRADRELDLAGRPSTVTSTRSCGMPTGVST